MTEHYEHLTIVREVPMAPRRRNANRGGSRYPDRGSRTAFADRLEVAAMTLVDDRASQPQHGLVPHLVFRVPLHAAASFNDAVAALERYGLTVVSAESKRMVIAFHDDVDLDQFLGAVERYRAGPKLLRSGERAQSTVADILQAIEPDGMTLWGRSDRVGSQLAKMIGASGGAIDPESRYLIDLELWYPGERAAASAIDEVHGFLSASAGSNEILDTYSAPGLVLLRATVTGSTLDGLLDVDVVAGVDLPPAPSFDTSAPLLASMTRFTAPATPPEDGPRVCVLDTGVSGGHPLLGANLGYAASFLSDDDSPADDYGHGTKVCGQAVFGNVRACYEADSFDSPVTLFSAKVIGRNGRFDDHRLAVSQVEDAVALFAGEPYNCKVFNLSVGVENALFANGSRRQGILAESIDRIARTYGVLMVVSSGNHPEAQRLEGGSSAVEDMYPGFLFGTEAGLCDPATAALALTVGGVIAGQDTEDDGSGQIRLAIAPRCAPAPMTRTGPGVNGAAKPEFAAEAGSAATLSSNGGGVRVVPDRGLSLLCLCNNPSDSLFIYGTGTSLAAPTVARTAAIVHHELTRSMGRAVHPNLVRALLASAAAVPDSVREVCASDDECARAVGYGLVSEEDALTSTATSVSLIAQEQLPLDHFHIYEIPVPEAFRNAKGPRSMTVTLAFDPPVRRRRLDYLGVEMDFLVVRGRTIEDVFESCRHCAADEEMAPSIQGAERLAFEPTAAPRLSATKRGRSCLQKASFFWRRHEARDYGESYWLVVRAKQKWPSGSDSQDYALAVTMRAADEDLYAQVRARVRERARTKTRRSV